jgi:hypothetical protein
MRLWNKRDNPDVRSKRGALKHLQRVSGSTSKLKNL